MNVHDIAIEIESILRKEFNIEHRPRGTIFDADAIESYSFYDMVNLILMLFGNGDFIDFLNSIFEYKNINMNKINNLDEIMTNFRKYYN